MTALAKTQRPMRFTLVRTRVRRPTTPEVLELFAPAPDDPRHLSQAELSHAADLAAARGDDKREREMWLQMDKAESFWDDKE